jgi:peptide/nickel transport system substrate-binding protein
MDQDELSGRISTHLETPFSRRRLLGAAGVAAAAALAPAGRLGNRAEAASITWAKAPVTFVFVDTQEPSHLDPAIGNEFDGFTVTRNIYDPLVWTDEANSKLVPWLATSWSTSSDGMTHTFHLRPGVVFHDGSKLDAATVKLSLDRYIAIGAPGEGYLLNDVASVSVVDSMTVLVKTKVPDSWLPAHLTKFPILSGAAIKANKTAADPWAKKYFETHAVGCGAYKLQSWQHGVKLTLTKNPQWWRGWRPGSIDTVIIQPTTESSTRVELVQSGQANFCTEWSITDALATGSKSGFTLRRYKTYDTDPVIFMNQQKPPLDKAEVRQAMQWAFDYDAMSKFYRGYSTGMNGPFPPFYPQVDKSLPTYKQDLPKARALLSKAGVNPSSLNISYMTPTGYADLVTAATITQASLQQIGVTVSIQQLPYGQIVSAYTKPGTSAMMTDIYNSPFTLDPTQFLSEFQTASSTSSFSHYDSAKLDAIIAKIQATTNKSTQQSLLNQAQRQLVNDAPVIWGATPETLIPVPNYLHGYVMQTTDYRFPCLFYLLQVAQH